MKISYDQDVDAAYFQLSNKRPSGAVEYGEDVIFHLTKDGEIVSIEILGASKRLSVKDLAALKTA